MTSTLLTPRRVERVWGTTDLPSWAPGRSDPDQPIGEIWYEKLNGADQELLVKLLFTKERLSIQVHPDEEHARAQGYRRGKEEAWFILAAEPDGVIGLGLAGAVGSADLRAAALDGTIEAMIDWRPVRPEQLIHSPAGTIHAIGAGISLIEIQQNLDLTYRLYDYGRPRELHLDDAVAVASRAPPAPPFAAFDHDPGRRILIAGGAFVIERWCFAGEARIEASDGQLLLIPLASRGAVDAQPLGKGGVWRVSGAASLTCDGPVDLLAAYPGGSVRPELCVVAEA